MLRNLGYDTSVPARMLLILEVAGQAASDVMMRVTKTKACLYINIYLSS